MKILCPKTGKQVYGTVARAEFVAARVAGEKGRPYRIYRCEFCGWFHTTSHSHHRGKPHDAA